MKNALRRVLVYLRTLVRISDEMDYENASTSIRKSIAFKGTNVFILACAIILTVVGEGFSIIVIIING